MADVRRTISVRITGDTDNLAAATKKAEASVAQTVRRIDGQTARVRVVIDEPTSGGFQLSKQEIARGLADWEADMNRFYRSQTSAIGRFGRGAWNAFRDGFENASSGTSFWQRTFSNKLKLDERNLAGVFIGAGQKAANFFQQGFQKLGKFGNAFGGIMRGVLVAAIVAVIPTLVTTIAVAVAGALGLVGIGAILAGAIVAAADEPKVTKAWERFTKRAKSAVEPIARAIIPNILSSLEILGFQIQENIAPKITKLVKIVRPSLDRATLGVTDFASRFLATITPGIGGAQKLFDKFFEKLPELGEALGKFFDIITNDPEVLKAFERFLDDIIEILPEAARLIAWLASKYDDVSDAVGATIGFFKDFFEAVKKIKNVIVDPLFDSEAWKEEWRKFKDFITDPSAWIEALKILWDKVSKFVGDTLLSWNTLWALMKLAFTAFTLGIGVAINNMVTSVSNTFWRLLPSWSQLLAQMLAIGKITADNIKNAFVDAFNRLQLQAFAVLNSIKAAFSRYVPVINAPVMENPGTKGFSIGNRALGGPVRGGVPYTWNEAGSGKEVFVASTDGTVMNSSKANSILGGSDEPTVNVILTGLPEAFQDMIQVTIEHNNRELRRRAMARVGG